MSGLSSESQIIFLNDYNIKVILIYDIKILTSKLKLVIRILIGCKL